MCENSIDEDLERYRRNNVELAVALNDLKSELNVVQMLLLDRNRELQRVYDENATMKQTLTKKDSEINTLRATIIDILTTNAKKSAEVMQKLGLTPTTNGAIKSNENSVTKIENILPTASPDQNQRINILRRPRCNVSPPHLPDLTEESIHSHLNESTILSSTPEKNVAARRRASIPPISSPSPPTPLRIIQERMAVKNELRNKKATVKVPKMCKIIDENVPSSGPNGRPTRRTAPKNLSEPNIRTKLRRD